jgi:hypothetical protein
MKNSIKDSRTEIKRQDQSIISSALILGVLVLVAFWILGDWKAEAAVEPVLRAKDITDDRGLYRELRQIKAQKQKDLNFDLGLNALAKRERAYAEDLPPVDVRGRILRPARRISQMPYRYGGQQN